MKRATPEPHWLAPTRRTAVVLQVVEVDVRVGVHLHLVAVADRDAGDVAGVLRAQPG